MVFKLCKQGEFKVLEAFFFEGKLIVVVGAEGQYVTLDFDRKEVIEQAKFGLAELEKGRQS